MDPDKEKNAKKACIRTEIHGLQHLPNATYEQMMNCASLYRELNDLKVQEDLESGENKQKWTHLVRRSVECELQAVKKALEDTVDYYDRAGLYQRLSDCFAKLGKHDMRKQARRHWLLNRRKGITASLLLEQKEGLEKKAARACVEEKCGACLRKSC